MDDRFKFICGVDVSYYSDDGDDKDVIVWFEPDSVTKYGEVGFDFDIIKNELKKLKLSQHEFNTAVDFIASNYETSIQDWCVADPRHLFQCTGKKDKNGKLIFEKDIVKITDKSTRTEPFIGVVEYTKTASFEANCNGFFMFLHDPKTKDNISYVEKVFCSSLREIEVIGNIYETPNLLELVK